MHFFNVSVSAIEKMRAELRRERRGLPIQALAQIRRDAPLELSFLVDLSVATPQNGTSSSPSSSAGSSND
jgi:hypothetical protein